MSFHIVITPLLFSTLLYVDGYHLSKKPMVLIGETPQSWNLTPEAPRLSWSDSSHKQGKHRFRKTSYLNTR